MLFETGPLQEFILSLKNPQTHHMSMLSSCQVILYGSTGERKAFKQPWFLAKSKQFGKFTGADC